METLRCVCDRILTQPNENIPTWRGKIHQKAVGGRKCRDLSRSEPQPVLEKAVAARWVLSSMEGGLATDIYGRGFCLSWLPTHLEALWKNPHLSHLFRHLSLHGPKVSPNKGPWANFWFQSFCFSMWRWNCLPSRGSCGEQIALCLQNGERRRRESLKPSALSPQPQPQPSASA